MKLGLRFLSPSFKLFLVIISGILTGISISQQNYWLIWFSFVPLFLALQSCSYKKSFHYGGVWGMVIGFILFNWMFFTTQRYTGTETLLGLPLLLITSLYYSIYPAFFSLFYRILHDKKLIIANHFIFRIILISIVWTILEWIRVYVFMGITWVKDPLTLTQGKCLYGLQFLSITGKSGISFIILFVNLLFANALVHKNIKFGISSLTIITIFYFSGFLIYSNHTIKNDRELRVAIIQENLAAETKWDENNGNKLANQLFELNRKATLYMPNLIVWSETALPWVYHPDDDLIKGALDLARESHAEHIIGMLSESETNPEKVLNSAYLFKANGNVVSRHDKVTLLSFIETSFLESSLKIPFVSEMIFSNILSGDSFEPLKSKYGHLGVIICNESISPYETLELVRNDAELIVVLSNDAWVENTHLVDSHFHSVRCRAIESGLDAIVNSNRGISGLIEGNGDIIIQGQSSDAQCVTGKVNLRKAGTFYSTFGDWFIYLGICVFLISFVISYISKRYFQSST